MTQTILNNIENELRSSQNDLWNELSTCEREEMLERAGFIMKRKSGEAEWLDNHSVSAETKRIVSEGMAHATKESFKIMGIKN